MKKILTLLLSLLLFVSFTSPAFAQNPGGDEFIFGGSRTLNEGEVIQGNLIIFGGNVDMPESSKVDGDLVVIGGNATVDGTITGNVEVLGGNVRLTDTAVVDGDVNAFGGHVRQAEGAAVGGQVEDLSEFGNHDDNQREFVVPSVPNAPDTSGVSWWFGRMVNIFEEITWNIGMLVGLALIGWLVAVFLPEQMQTIGDTVAQTPLVSFGMGLLTATLAVVLGIPLALLILTVCLAIIPFAVYILLGIALLLGWVVIGQLIGERLLTSVERPLPNFALSTALGVVVLTVISNMPIVGVIPIIGPIFSFLGVIFGLLVALTGLGAVALTRYGTRPYTTSSSFGSGSTAYTPYTPPNPSRGLDRLSAAEAELKAKIKAALAEADQAESEKEAEPKTTSPEPEPEPEPETPSDEPPDRETPQPDDADPPKPKQ